MSYTHLMPLERIDDWEQRIARQDAFWDRQVLDRPVVVMTLPARRAEQPPPVARSYASHRERWLDVDYVVEQALGRVRQTEYLGDALPTVWPNLGPEVFSAFFGCELEFGETTSWSVPCLRSWDEVGRVRFSRDNVYWKKLEEMTDALLAAGRGRFFTGLTDFHPGGDAIAALRDPMVLNLDMIDHVEEVKALLRYVTDRYFEVYDHFYAKLRAAGQPVSTWAGIVSTRKWYVPSNDFSCMISKAMFDEVFLPGIIEECRFLEASIYHLDGPGALHHLDSLLGISELNAIQWVPGAGHGSAVDWIAVYRKCQAAGKGVQIGIRSTELPCLMEALRPEGVWLSVQVESREEAEAVLKSVARWK